MLSSGSTFFPYNSNGTNGDKILQKLSHVITTHPGILLSPYLLFPSNEKKNWERAIYGNHLPLSYMYGQTL